MTRQSEQVLEDSLVKQLTEKGYDFIKITDEDDLLDNLKIQLEKHNEITLSDAEFIKVLNHLNKGNVFERAKILRDKMQFTRDDGSAAYIEFINQDSWCKNQFQVTQQVSMEGAYKNRYDVTLLINGLPLVQIELKRRGLELKEAFNQVQRYHRHSFSTSYGLYNYVQIFIISNGVNTKYYANNKKQSFKQSFYWSDVNNNKITNLKDFADEFLEACHLSKMITKYIVLAETTKILMVLRPYQYYATEAIIDRVQNSNKNGYIWHTTGSGKTLTSFKASQILMNMPEVHKVVFVVDRRDLDYQTTKEFNSFSAGSVDGTDNTNKLVKQFADDTKLIVTTIQKLNNAISNKRYLKRMEAQKDMPIVFMFDECHRSQFGDTHKRIDTFFTNNQMFGFTGTPIFAENAVSTEVGKRTTTDLFDKPLHKYVITDAIRDENVLRFSIEYVGRYRKKNSSANFIDIDVEGIDTKELFESEERLNKITDYIIANHSRKTHNKDFTAIFAVSSIDTLKRYYELFRQKKEAEKHNLRIATIFSYTTNEEDADADGMIDIPDTLPLAAEPQMEYKTQHSRDKLEEYIGDYNKMFGTAFTTKDSQSYYNYYNDIAKKVKNRQIDILLVVNMFLTGFDSKPLNTLYVDKNLRYHGLIQAYSRTNRILNERKSQGNIITFRNLKKATDTAITLFSNKDAIDTVVMQPYEDYINKFNDAYVGLMMIAPTLKSIDDLQSENDEFAFVKAFRAIMRVKNTLSSFADFDWEDLAMNEQSFEDYKSKYLDLHDKVKSEKSLEKDSILDDVDFELDLIRKDNINVAYILNLLSQLKDAKGLSKTHKRKQISDLLSGEAHLRSKKELIEKFIDENLEALKDGDDVEAAFEQYWDKERLMAIDKISNEENVHKEGLQKLIDSYIFSEKVIERDDVISLLKSKPKLLERKPIAVRIIDKIMGFVSTFVDGVAA